MDRAVLMAIIGPQGARAAGAAIRSGADLVQVRARALGASELLALVKAVIAEVGDAGRVIVNSRPDIAALTGAKGVHLPESGLDVRAVRAAFPDLSVGVSRHDRQGLDRAAEEGADYAILGPVFMTPGKEARALGLTGFREMLDTSSLPLIGVGGITVANALEVIGQGARGVAAIRPFADEVSAAAAAAAFRCVLDSVPPRGVA